MDDKPHRSDAGVSTRSRPIFAGLLLCEATLAFALGVFGNKVADTLKISIGFVALGAMATLILLYLITLARLRFEAGEKLIPGAGTGTANRFQHALVMFPAGIVGGILVGTLVVLALPGRPVWLVPNVMFDYELVAFVAGALFLGFIVRRNPARSPLMAFGFGYGLGIAAIEEVLRPVFNKPIPTFAWTSVASLIAGLIISSEWFRRAMKGFEDAIRPSAR
jgi:hypothetical protein